MSTGSQTLATTVKASEFLQLVLKDIGKHQQEDYEKEFTLQERTNIAGERGEKFRHRIALKSSWQHKHHRIALINEEVKHDHRFEEWRPCSQISALLFEMPHSAVISESLFSQAIIYPGDDWKGGLCSWSNELFHITRDKNGVITCNKGSEHPLFYDAVRNCIHPRDKMDFSPLRYEIDQVRTLTDSLKTLAKDRIKQVITTQSASPQPVSINN